MEGVIGNPIRAKKVTPSSLQPSLPISSPPRQSNRHDVRALDAVDPAWCFPISLSAGVDSGLPCVVVGLVGETCVGRILVLVNDEGECDTVGRAKGFERRAGVPAGVGAGGAGAAWADLPCSMVVIPMP